MTASSASTTDESRLGAPILRLSDVSITLPEGSDRTHAVQSFSLRVDAGQCVCLVGESGSGKSVTGQAALGLLPPALRQTSGTIAFCGAPLEPTMRGRRIGMIFQEPTASLDPIMRVGAQIEEVLLVHGLRGQAARRARALDLLRAVQLPTPERIHRAYPHEISGGQAQRVVIAMALAFDPELLIADEPTTALDVTTQAEILRLLRNLQRERGAGLLFITHDLGIVADIADHVVVMQNGIAVEEGPAASVLATPHHPYTQSLLAALPRRRSPRARAGATTPPVLEAEGITVSYRASTGVLRRTRIPAVREVSLTLRRGQTHGIVGESGSGKSTLVRALLHLEPRDAGRVRIDGIDTAKWGTGLPREVRQRIQIVLQDPYTALNPRQRVGDTVAEAARIHGASRTDAAARAASLLERVGLSTQAAARYPHEFSGGQRQRICIARALATEPEILIADEAVSALDVSVQAQILALFRDLQDRLGFAMLFVTHDLRVASAICDEITVMRDGRVVEQGPMEQIFDAPRDPYTRALLDAIPDKAGRAGIRHAAPSPEVMPEGVGEVR